MTTLNYLGQNGKSIQVSYNRLPLFAQVDFLNQVSQEKTPARGLPFFRFGTGTASIPTTSLKGGQYRLVAEKAGAIIAQTVMFYIANPADGGG
jgi:hypothetical protein